VSLSLSPVLWQILTSLSRARHLRLPTAAPKPLPPNSNNYPRRNFLAVPGKRAEESGESSPVAAHSTISSTYIGGPCAASISMKSASPRIHLSALSRDRSPFRSGEGSSLARARSENGDLVAPSARKAPSSVASMDAPVSRRAWPDLSRKPRLYLAPKP
jgi:protein SFI1